MDILKRHEIFEIEILEALKNAKLLEPLVFGGGTMLRLCYGLNRYSADLDFWFIKQIRPALYLKKAKEFLKKRYEVTDAQIKFYTILFELRSQKHPRRLKIEIRKHVKKSSFQEKIAFSKYNTRQVLLRVHTLEEVMKRKIEAALERHAIRDAFDIEFLLRRGVTLEVSEDKKIALKKLIQGFKTKDYKVTLGSALEPDMRNYYAKSGFDYLLKRLTEI